MHWLSNKARYQQNHIIASFRQSLKTSPKQCRPLAYPVIHLHARRWASWVLATCGRPLCEQGQHPSPILGCLLPRSLQRQPARSVQALIVHFLEGQSWPTSFATAMQALPAHFLVALISRKRSGRGPLFHSRHVLVKQSCGPDLEPRIKRTCHMKPITFLIIDTSNKP